MGGLEQSPPPRANGPPGPHPLLRRAGHAVLAAWRSGLPWPPCSIKLLEQLLRLQLQLLESMHSTR